MEWKKRVVVFVGEYLQEVPLRQEARRRTKIYSRHKSEMMDFLHIFRTASMCARKAPF